MTNIQKTIKSRLNEKGISISKVSRLAGIHHSTLAAYLRGVNSIRLKNLQKVLDVLDLKLTIDKKD